MLATQTAVQSQVQMMLMLSEPNQLFGKGSLLKGGAHHMVISSTSTDAANAASGAHATQDAKLKKQKTQLWESVVNIILIEGQNLSTASPNANAAVAAAAAATAGASSSPSSSFAAGSLTGSRDQSAPPAYLPDPYVKFKMGSEKCKSKVGVTLESPFTCSFMLPF